MCFVNIILLQPLGPYFSELGIWIFVGTIQSIVSSVIILGEISQR